MWRHEQAMPQKAKPVGNKYGNLTVLGRHIGNTTRNAQWLCRCVCGRDVVVNGGELRKGNRTSCGCSQRRFRLRPYESLYNWLVEHTARYGKYCELSYPQFLEFTKIKNCHYCGLKVKWAKFNISVNGNSYNLDRKDNKVGYTKSNCVVCCSTCNSMKSTLSYIAFVRRVKRIAKRLK